MNGHLGYINGRPKTRYEYFLEKELERRKTRQGFTRFLFVASIGMLAVITILAAT